MISQKITDAINEQINEELYSSYLYLSMAAWLKSQNWDGMGQWMIAQAKEEDMHAKKFFGYLLERGAKVELKAIKQPQIDWESTLEVFKDALKHEKHITARINHLYKLALEEADYPSQILLQWFITEQVEEEASVDQVIQMMERINGHMSGMVMLDRQLAQRQ